MTTLLQQRLAAFDGAAISVRVRREITRELAQGEPRREAIANALKMSDRTLQRRLHDEGVTFDRLLDATRCDLAQHYLARSNLTTADVANLLGFADPGTFFRACKSWFDASPSRFRASMLERQKAPAIDATPRDIDPTKSGYWAGQAFVIGLPAKRSLTQSR